MFLGISTNLLNSLLYTKNKIDNNFKLVFQIFIDICKIEEGSADIIATISGALFNSNNHPIAQYSYDSELFATVNICKQGHAISIYTTENCSWLCIQVTRLWRLSML